MASFIHYFARSSGKSGNRDQLDNDVQRFHSQTNEHKHTQWLSLSPWSLLWYRAASCTGWPAPSMWPADRRCPQWGGGPQRGTTSLWLGSCAALRWGIVHLCTHLQLISAHHHHYQTNRMWWYHRCGFSLSLSYCFSLARPAAWLSSSTRSKSGRTWPACRRISAVALTSWSGTSPSRRSSSRSMSRSSSPSSKRLPRSRRGSTEAASRGETPASPSLYNDCTTFPCTRFLTVSTCLQATPVHGERGVQLLLGSLHPC